ncbi:MAG: redoxin domain-containing protein [Pirellulales bacterium]
MRGFLAIVTLAGAVLFSADRAAAIDPYAGNDPYWVLLHEPAVLDELQLSAAKRQSYRERLDELDLRFFPLRNKPAETALAGAKEIIAEARESMKTLLTPPKSKRLTQILLRKIGTPALLRDDVRERLRYTDEQRKQMAEIMEKTKAAVAEVEQMLLEGKPREPLDKEYVELMQQEYQRIQELLTPEQRSAWREMLGPAFDLAKLGRPAFKAPELVDTGAWINSPPLQLKELRGKVVVVHFYAFSCINCIHNYPWYRAWHDRFHDQGVVVLGIHTPETAGEKDLENVRRKASEDKFEFPVLVDGQNENWNAWGNSMWPSVYLIDKRGYLRQFWPGELNWQGGKGEEYMRGQIESLMAEK